MGLFFKKKKTDDNVVFSPLSGDIKPIESLKDQTFANKVMGDGIAIVPTEGKVYAPCDGTISALLATKHAYGISLDSGAELLIHVGQDTVNLKGKYFETNVKEGDKVRKGDLLGTFDIDNIVKEGYEIATPVIVIAGNSFVIKEKTVQNHVNAGDSLLILERK